MAKGPKATGTAHVLPFEKLSPLDFERMCLWLVKAEGYESAEHLGAAGSEQGRDIVALREGRRVVFQCKRVEKLSPTKAEQEIRKLQALAPGDRPDDVVFVVSSAVGVKARDRARSGWGDRGSCEFWAGSELDQKVRQYPDILKTFFDLRSEDPIQVTVKTARCEKPLPTPREAPLPADYFTGRTELMGAMRDMLLESGNGTSVAVCGLGGVGKSALASAVAVMPEVEEHYNDGTFWFDLSVTDPMTALDRIGCTFGFDVSVHSTLPSRSQVVRTLLRDKRVLLVLDNAWESAQLSPLLPGSSTVSAIVTTRDEGLGSDLCEEVVLLEELTEEQGMRLLTTLVGAEMTAASRRACREMTRFLGHFPLAIELVGKRMRRQARRPGFSWTDSLAKLKKAGGLGLSGRDRSLRATFASSYEALGGEGRTVFQHCGLLERMDLDYGVIVAAMEADEDLVTEQLESLTDLSCLRQLTPSRYGMHTLLYEYAREMSAELSPELKKAVATRVADHLFDRARLECRTPGSVEDIQPVLRSHHYSVEADDRERAGRVYPWFGDLPIPGFLNQRGYQLTLLQVREERLGLAGSELEIAWDEYQLGEGYADVGLHEKAIPHLASALELYASNEYDLMIAKLSYQLGQAHREVGDSQKAIEHFERSIEEDRKIGSKGGIGLTMVQIGDLYRNTGDPQQAWEVYDEARRYSRSNGEPRSEAVALIRLGELSWQSAPEQAIELLDTAASLDSAVREERLGSGQRVQVTTAAFAGWDGARLLLRIGDTLKALLFNGHDVLQRTASCYWRAARMARNASSPLYECVALFRIAHLMEHLFLVEGMTSDLPGAFVCYQRSAELSEAMELPPDINPRQRLESRIVPRIEKEGGALPTPADPDAFIEASVRRLFEPA